ncbi:DUF6702 family protein [Constantimarinum furrinae]|uniref:Peptidase E n=1 Tax=Constantimarinum furrinae TaxID=2562285 RepID=A0A7G8PRA2_9FLAO|nr:DUF6702 family protein [Constantimarinum furrinae]QNJ96868.1 peptidase E [Constantimarinum furrinae]
MKMKFFKIAFLLFLVPLLTASTTHKFYVSITNVEYVEKKESLQIISKIFIEDLETVLQKRFDPNVHLASKKETKKDLALLQKYVLQKINISVNDKPVNIKYIGKEYDIDVVKIYLEVEGVKKLNSLEIENKILHDLFDEQQNIIHLKTPSTRRSLILEKENPKGLLNLN